MVKTSITKLMKRGLMLFATAFMVGASAASASTFDSIDSFKANLEQRITNSNIHSDTKKELLKRLKENTEDPVVIEHYFDYYNTYFGNRI